MTESMSGFLSPEEHAVLEQRKRAMESEPGSDLSLAILQTLAEHGRTTLSELPSKVHARPRAVLSAIDDLERSGLVQVSARGVEEIAELTGEGHKTIPS